MSSFLEKLKGTIEAEEAASRDERRPAKRPEGFLQLDVDIYQTDTEIIIYTLVPGVEVKDLDITIEGDNDIITITGNRPLPAMAQEMIEKQSGKLLKRELLWGPFFRQIILPQEINVQGVEAKLNKGVLVIRLPLLKIDIHGKRKVTVE